LEGVWVQIGENPFKWFKTFKLFKLFKIGLEIELRGKLQWLKYERRERARV
jgi:hypothetical protein